jgi:hypothetical protein
LGISGNRILPNNWSLSVPKYEETRIIYEPKLSSKKRIISLVIKIQKTERAKKIKTIG